VFFVFWRSGVGVDTRLTVPAILAVELVVLEFGLGIWGISNERDEGPRRRRRSICKIGSFLELDESIFRRREPFFSVILHPVSMFTTLVLCFSW
jgi:hypothetical protein